MTKWPTKQLGEVLKVQNGFAFDSKLFTEQADGMPLIRIRDLGRGFTETFYRGAYAERYLVNPGDFLIGMDGEFRCYRWLGPPALLNQRVCRLLSFSSSVLPDFVFYGINEHLAAIEANTGFSTVKHLSSRQVEEIEIPLPPLSEQERIVRTLDEADALRRLAAEADAQTNLVIGSLFRKTFGSLLTNPFGWPVIALGDVFEKRRDGVKCGPFGSALKKHEYTDKGISVWGIPNVLPNRFVEDGSLFISPEKFEELRAYAVEPGDILISRAGTVGRVCVARPRATQSIIGTNLIRLTLDRERIAPEFFSSLITYFAGELSRLRADTGEGSYSFMNTTALKDLRIYIPPLSLQESFADRVGEVRDLEAAQHASRTRLSDLFQSLLHRAFRGDL
jgi:type I restriction enzyme S subunit